MKYQEINAEEETAKELVEQDLQTIIGAGPPTRLGSAQILIDKMPHTVDLKKIIDKRLPKEHRIEPYHVQTAWGAPPFPRTRSASAFESSSQRDAHIKDLINMVSG